MILAVGRFELRLSPEAAPTDLAAFRAAVVRNSHERLREALDLYRSPFLAGFEDEWAMPIRADLARTHVQALLPSPFVTSGSSKLPVDEVGRTGERGGCEKD